MPDIGGAWINVRANLSTFRSEVQSGVSSGLSGFKANIPVGVTGDGIENQIGLLKQRITKAIEYAGIGEALNLGKELLVGSVDEYTKQQQQIAQTTNLFSGYSDAVLKAGENSATTMGLSQVQALTTENSFGRMFQSYGEGAKQSAADTVALTQRLADVSGVTGRSQADITGMVEVAARGGAKGLKTLKELGVGIDEAKLKTDAQKWGMGTPVDNTDAINVVKAHIQTVKDEITKGHNTIANDPRVRAEKQAAVNVAKTMYDKDFAEGPNTVKTANAKIALAKAQDALNASGSSGIAVTDQMRAKQADLAVSQDKLNKLQQASMDISDPLIREQLIYKEFMDQTAKDIGGHAKSPAAPMEDFAAALKNAEGAMGKGLYPELVRFSDWASAHSADIATFAGNAGDFIGKAAAGIGDTVGYIQEHWSVIEPFLKLFGAVFALEKMAKWGSMLLGTLEEAGKKSIWQRVFPTLTAYAQGKGGAPDPLGTGSKTVAGKMQTVAEMTVENMVVAKMENGFAPGTAPQSSYSSQAEEDAVVAGQGTRVGDTAGKSFLARVAPAAMGAMIAVPIVMGLDSWLTSKGAVGISDLLAGNVHNPFSSDWGGKVSDLTALQSTIGMEKNNGFMGTESISKAVDVANNAFGSQAVQDAAVAGNANAIENVSKFIQANLGPAGADVAKKYDALAMAVQNGSVNSATSFQAFLDNYNASSSQVAVNLQGYAKAIADGTVEYDAAIAQTIANFNLGKKPSDQVSLGGLSQFNSTVGPKGISATEGINMGQISQSTADYNKGLPSKAAGGWLTHPEVIEAGHGVGGEGVFQPEQVQALYQMGINVGATSGQKTKSSGGDNYHIYNPTTNVDVIQSIRRQRYLKQLDVLGVEPAPGWPAY